MLAPNVEQGETASALARTDLPNALEQPNPGTVAAHPFAFAKGPSFRRAHSGARLPLRPRRRGDGAARARRPRQPGLKRLRRRSTALRHDSSLGASPRVIEADSASLSSGQPTSVFAQSRHGASFLALIAFGRLGAEALACADGPSGTGGMTHPAAQERRPFRAHRTIWRGAQRPSPLICRRSIRRARRWRRAPPALASYTFSTRPFTAPFGWRSPRWTSCRVPASPKAPTQLPLKDR